VRDIRVIAVQRFASERICGHCNNLDSIHSRSRPGHWFSLSPMEMRFVRRFAGSTANRGATVIEALCFQRRAAGRDYAERIGPAVLIGRTLADEMAL